MTNPSPLHEKAVAMIAEACRHHGGYEQPKQWLLNPATGIYLRLQPGKDEWSGDIMEGVSTVKIPDPEWDNVAGIVPDLILSASESKPRRIIEVIVTNPPDDKKRRKLDTLQSRGVDVVEVIVKSDADLLDLFPPLRLPGFSIVWPPGNRFLLQRQEQSQATAFLDQLTTSLMKATPSARRRFFHVLSQADGVEALYPTPAPAKSAEGTLE